MIDVKAIGLLHISNRCIWSD